MTKFPEEVRQAAQQIGQFYLQKNKNDYKKTEQEILSLGITKIDTPDENTICIHLSRPGLFIGCKGQNLENLEKFINKKIKIYEENNILDLIVPYQEDDDYLEFEYLMETSMYNPSPYFYDDNDDIYNAYETKEK